MPNNDTRTAMHNDSSRPLPHDLAALIHHVELSKAGWRERALRHLLLATVARHPAGVSPDEIHREASTGLPSPLVRAEVDSVLDSLKSQGRIVQLANGASKLSEETRDEFNDRMIEATNRQHQVEHHFRHACSNLPDRIDLTWTAFLDEFLVPLISELGAKTYNILTGQDTDLQHTNTYLRFLSQFSDTDHPAIFESISRFVDSGSDAVRKYVLGLLNTAFLIRVLALPAGALEALLRRTARTLRLRVFVDTNFMFSLLGLHVNPADDIVRALHDVIAQMPNRMNVKLYMLPCTMDEARQTIARYEEKLSLTHRSRRIVDAIRDGTTDLSGISLTYFREAYKGGQYITAKDYFAPYLTNFIDVARSKGIELFNASVDDLRMDQDVIDDLTDQLEREQNRPEGRRKSYETVLHDMMLWHFTKRLRPPRIDSPLDAEAWVVTIDYGLLGFDAFRIKRESSKIPVCIHPTVLLQVLQFWIPHNDVLDAALMNSLRPMPPRFDHRAEEITVRIIRSLSRFENVDDLPKDTVTDILLSEAVKSKIDKAKNDEEELDIVRVEIAAQNRLLSEKLDRYQQIVEKREQAVEESEQTIAALENDVLRLGTERESAQDMLKAESEARERLEARFNRMEKETRETQQRTAREAEIEKICRRGKKAGTSVFVVAAIVLISIGAMIIEMRDLQLAVATIVWGAVAVTVFAFGLGAWTTWWILGQHPATRDHALAKRAKDAMKWCWGGVGAGVLIGGIANLFS